MELIGEEVLRAILPIFRAARPGWEADIVPEMLADPLAGRWLWYYGLLTEMPELVENELDPPRKVFWSRYYCFHCFRRLWEIGHGPNVGLDQQEQQLLENEFGLFHPEWEHGAAVEGMAERDLQAQLQVHEAGGTAGELDIETHRSCEVTKRHTAIGGTDADKNGLDCLGDRM